MASNSQTFRELQSLRDELSTARRERPSPAVSPPSSPHPDAGISANGSEGADAGPQKGASKQGLPSEDVRELVDEVAQFFQENAKSIAANPAASVIGALAVGVIVGWMLARRGR